MLTEEASDEAPSYRDAAKRWALSDGLVAAFEGPPAVRGPSALVRVPPVVAALLLFLAVFGGAGELAMSRAARDLTAYTSGPATGPGTAVIFALVTPFRRRAALSALVAALDTRSDPDLEAVAERVAIHQALGERLEAASIWMDHADPAEGALLAENERSFALAAHGWYAAGRFEQAADAWDRATIGDDEEALRFGVGVQLFAQRPDRAARVARRLATVIRAHPAPNEELRQWYAARADMVVCLADALDARRGDARAWAALHADASRDHDWEAPSSPPAPSSASTSSTGPSASRPSTTCPPSRTTPTTCPARGSISSPPRPTPTTARPRPTPSRAWPRRWPSPTASRSPASCPRWSATSPRPTRPGAPSVTG